MSIQIPITPTVPVRLGRSAVTGLVVTVFGASGFVARNLISRLGGMGAQVIVPYRSSDMDVRHLKVHGELGNIINLKIDLKDKNSLKRAVEHSSIVFNLIGRNYGTKRYNLNQINVDTAATIAEVVSEMNIEKFIHLSALGASPDANSNFLRSKFESENVVRSLTPKATIVRPAVLFGLRDSYLNRVGWMSAFCPFFPLPSNPGKIQPLYITDLIDSLMHILDVLENEDSRKGKTYDLAGPTVYTHEQIYKYVNIVTERDRDVKRIPRLFEFLFELSNFQREPFLTRDMFNMMKDDIVVPKDSKNTIEKLINTKKYPLTELKEVIGTLISHWKTSNDYYKEPGTDNKDLSDKLLSEKM